jgi:hypothetical protein
MIAQINVSLAQSSRGNCAGDLGGRNFGWEGNFGVCAGGEGNTSFDPQTLAARYMPRMVNGAHVNPAARMDFSMGGRGTPRGTGMPRARQQYHPYI